MIKNKKGLFSLVLIGLLINPVTIRMIQFFSQYFFILSWKPASHEVVETMRNLSTDVKWMKWLLFAILAALIGAIITRAI